jgi:hypothetical protein
VALREVLAFLGFEVDSTELEKGNALVDQFKSGLLGVGKAVAGAFAVKEIVGFGKELVNQADELREAAIALGAVPQELQVLEFAAGQAGVEVGELRASLARFNKTAAESAKGKGASETFKKLGVELKNADGTIKSSGQLFEEVGVAIGKIEDPIERAGAASEFFGKSYAKLLPFFAEGPEGMRKAREEAEALGFVFDTAFLENSDEINDRLDKLKRGLVGIAIQAIAPLLPYVKSFVEGSIKVVKGLVGWVRQTKILQALTIALTGKGVLALGRAVFALVARFGGWRAILMRLLPILLKFVAPLLILEDFLVFLAGGKSLTGNLLDKAFGPGTQENVRQIIKSLGEFFALFKTKPEEVRAAFAKLPEDLARSLGAFGAFLGGWGQEIVNVALFAVNVITGGWQNFARKMKALWDGVKLAGAIAWTELKFGGLAAAAAIADAWDSAWNAIFGTIADTLGNDVVELVDRLEAEDQRRIAVLLEHDGGEEGGLEAMRGAVADDAAEAAQGRAAGRRLGVIRQAVQIVLNGERRPQPRDQAALARRERNFCQGGPKGPPYEDPRGSDQASIRCRCRSSSACRPGR